MANSITRFPHIATQIFEQLDNKSLTNCREVSKSWQKFIDDNHLPHNVPKQGGGRGFSYHLDLNYVPFTHEARTTTPRET